jgi:hypothetical protein
LETKKIKTPRIIGFVALEKHRHLRRGSVEENT